MLFSLLFSSLSHCVDLLWTWICQEVLYSLWLASRVRKADEVPDNFSCSVGSSASLEASLGGSSRREERLSLFCDLRTPLGQLLIYATPRIAKLVSDVTFLRSEWSEAVCQAILLSLSPCFAGGLPGHCCYTPTSKANGRCWSELSTG